MSEVNILHISPQQFLEMSFRLGRKLFESGFRPKHTISVWRGGTPVGLGVDAFYRNRGIFMNHTTIATESYTGIGQQSEVVVKGLEHVINVICREDDLLILDDVYESGRTIEAIVGTLRKRARANCPERIVVGTLHHKPEKQKYSGLPLVTVQELPGDVWIDYPHELADLVQDDHPDDPRIRSKDQRTWELLHAAPPPPSGEWTGTEPVHYLTAQEVYYDAVELALQMARGHGYVPDVLIALWPGGIHAGLPIHEVYKYLHKKGEIARVPDHVSLNTTRTHQSFRDNIIGLPYLVDRIEAHHRVLIVDTAFRSGRLISDVITKLKEQMRRNLSLDRLSVATLYYNPKEDATWTVNPFVKEPHFYRHRVRQTLVYPHAVHRLPNPIADCRRISPELHRILYVE